MNTKHLTRLINQNLQYYKRTVTKW